MHMPKNVNRHPLPPPLRNLPRIELPLEAPRAPRNKLAQKSTKEPDPDKAEPGFSGSLRPAVEAGAGAGTGV